MLREILRDNIDDLLLSVQKIGRAFDIVKGKKIGLDDIREIKRLIHSLKGNLQAIGMNDEALNAIKLEEEIFHLISTTDKVEIIITHEEVNGWFTLLNSIEFSLKGYLF
jgi:hypothetical protein